MHGNVEVLNQLIGGDIADVSRLVWTDRNIIRRLLAIEIFFKLRLDSLDPFDVSERRC